jgi:hypothetical protein
VIPTLNAGGGKRVNKGQLAEFWMSAGHDSAEAKGCYVFAMRAGKGIRPVYVGRANNTFRAECFTTDKLLKLTNAMTAYRKGTPVLFLVVHERRKGKPNLKAIGAVEEFLVQNALVRNPDNLQNVHFTKKSNWWIAGVFRSQQGKPSQAARRFRKALGL